MTEMYGATTSPDIRDLVGPVESRKVINVRVGHHPDQRFDRVVFDLSAGGDVGWFAEYVDAAHRQGSGEQVDVPGGAIIAVMLRGMDWTNPDIDEYDGAPIDVSGDGVVAVRWDGSFEGDSQVFIGTTRRLPFRLAALEDPRRIYVDVAYGG